MLPRSQDTRPAALLPAADDSQRPVRIHADFTQLVRALPANAPEVEQSLADLPEHAGLFIVAHELGHVMNGHWLQMAQVYQKWIPGEVTQPHTDAIAAALGRDASALSRRQEYEADAFAAHLLHVLGVAQPELLATFVQIGSSPDRPAHPGARQGSASLRALDLAR